MSFDEQLSRRRREFLIDPDDTGAKLRYQMTNARAMAALDSTFFPMLVKYIREGRRIKLLRRPQMLSWNDQDEAKLEERAIGESAPVNMGADQIRDLYSRAFRQHHVFEAGSMGLKIGIYHASYCPLFKDQDPDQDQDVIDVYPPLDPAGLNIRNRYRFLRGGAATAKTFSVLVNNVTHEFPCEVK